jgi:hypothetical protein
MRQVVRLSHTSKVPGVRVELSLVMSWTSSSVNTTLGESRFRLTRRLATNSRTRMTPTGLTMSPSDVWETTLASIFQQHPPVAFSPKLWIPMKEDDNAFVSAPHADNLSVLQALQQELSENLRATSLQRTGGGRQVILRAPLTDPQNPPVLGNHASAAEQRRRALAVKLAAILEEVFRDVTEDTDQGNEALP